MKLLTAMLVLMVATGVLGDEPRREREQHERSYDIRRQEAYMVQGPPTDRLLIGRRQLDGYTQRDGSKVWFERDNVVGVTR